MTSARTTIKLQVPHTAAPECPITGVLEQLDATLSIQGRKIALILHGTMGHKDYLFQKRLALRLPMDSFRFDFRGNHETPGSWRQAGFTEDLVDLRVVVEYLQRKYGYVIDLLVGHSRGSVVACNWICTSEEGKNVSGFVNVSGRYRMARIYDGTEQWKTEFETQGFHEWRVTVARKPVVGRVYPSDLAAFANWDTSIVWTQFPVGVDAFSIHGLADKTVPPYDALIYAKALGNRQSGTHNLHMVEDADHNFTGRQDEVVGAILEWWEARQKGDLTTGVWLTGVKGKL